MRSFQKSYRLTGRFWLANVPKVLRECVRAAAVRTLVRICFDKLEERDNAMVVWRTFRWARKSALELHPSEKKLWR